MGSVLAKCRFVAALCAIAALTGCGSIPPPGSAASGARTSAAPTPSVVPVPSGYTTYVNAFDHNFIAYPAAWFIVKATATGDAVSISNEAFDPNVTKPGRWKLDIVSLNNPQGLSATQWADKAKSEAVVPSGCTMSVGSDAPVTVGTENGIERHESDCRGSAFAIYAPHNGRMFVIDATDQPAFQPAFASIVATMVFTQ